MYVGLDSSAQDMTAVVDKGLSEASWLHVELISWSIYIGCVMLDTTMLFRTGLLRSMAINTLVGR